MEGETRGENERRKREETANTILIYAESNEILATLGDQPGILPRTPHILSANNYMPSHLLIQDVGTFGRIQKPLGVVSIEMFTMLRDGCSKSG